MDQWCGEQVVCVCEQVVWAAGGQAGAGRRKCTTKDKNPTQRCGEEKEHEEKWKHTQISQANASQLQQRLPRRMHVHVAKSHSCPAK